MSKLATLTTLFIIISIILCSSQTTTINATTSPTISFQPQQDDPLPPPPSSINATVLFTSSDGSNKKDNHLSPSMINGVIQIDLNSYDDFNRPIEMNFTINGIQMDPTKSKKIFDEGYKPSIIMNIDGDYAIEIDPTKEIGTMKPHDELYAPYYIIPLFRETYEDDTNTIVKSPTILIHNGWSSTYPKIPYNDIPKYEQIPKRFIHLMVPLKYMLTPDSLEIIIIMQYKDITPQSTSTLINYPITTSTLTWNKDLHQYPYHPKSLNYKIDQKSIFLTTSTSAPFRTVQRNGNEPHPTFFQVQHLTIKQRFALLNQTDTICQISNPSCDTRCDTDGCYQYCIYVPNTKNKYKTNVNQYRLQLSVTPSTPTLMNDHRFSCSDVVNIEQKPYVRDYRGIYQVTEYINTNDPKFETTASPIENWSPIEKFQIKQTAQWSFKIGNEYQLFHEQYSIRKNSSLLTIIMLCLIPVWAALGVGIGFIIWCIVDKDGCTACCSDCCR